MKKLLPFLLVLATSTLFAQSPDAFNYQAVVRDASGNILANQTVGLRLAILQGSPSGTIVYQESFAPTTSALGLANVKAGAGTVLNGNFTTINWENGPYFMQVAVDPAGGTSYAVLGTSQLVSVPYALHAKTAANGFSGDYNDLINVPTSTGGGNTLNAAYNQGGAGAGRSIVVNAGEVDLTTATPNGIALRVTNTNTGAGIIAKNTGASNTFSTVQAETNSTSTGVSAIVGSTTGAAHAIAGQAEVASTAQSAIYGSNLRTNGGHGVHGVGFNGVVGETNYSTGNAVFAENYDQGTQANGIAVAGTGFYGVVGQDRYLGQVAGAVGLYANGNFTASGTKAFTIDHPSDPENRFLRHFSTESNEVLNMYRGNVTFDTQGEAVVEMPDYYDLINKNPSYQLTSIGGYAPLYVKEELANGKFTIAGGQQGMKASWTVYAERNDAYLREYPFQRDVELEKREGQKGKYLMPQLYGQGKDKMLFPFNGKEGMQQEKIELTD